MRESIRKAWQFNTINIIYTIMCFILLNIWKDGTGKWIMFVDLKGIIVLHQCQNVTNSCSLFFRLLSRVRSIHKRQLNLKTTHKQNELHSSINTFNILLRRKHKTFQIHTDLSYIQILFEFWCFPSLYGIRLYNWCNNVYSIVLYSGCAS